jgi:hypothetical protein
VRAIAYLGIERNEGTGLCDEEHRDLPDTLVIDIWTNMLCCPLDVIGGIVRHPGRLRAHGQRREKRALAGRHLRYLPVPGRSTDLLQVVFVGTSFPPGWSRL